MQHSIDWVIMDTIHIGFDDNGELVDVTPTEPESMDTVYITPGRKVTWAEQACRTLGIEP